MKEFIVGDNFGFQAIGGYGVNIKKSSSGSVFIPYTFKDLVLGSYATNLLSVVGGGDLVDSSVNNTPVFISGATPSVKVPDQQNFSNKAYYYSGTYVGVNIGSSIGQTMILWAKCLDVVTDHGGIMSMGGIDSKTSANLFLEMKISDADGLYDRNAYGAGGNVTGQRLYPSGILTDWNMFTIMYDFSKNHRLFMINGSKLVDSTSDISAVGTLIGSSFIGRSTIYTDTTNGSMLIGGWAFWNAGLTSGQILDIWDKTKS